MNSRASWSDFSNMDGATAIALANRHLPPLISLLLVILVSWQVAKILWLMVPGPAAGERVPIPATLPAATSSSGGSTDVRAIAATHLFGIADAEDEGPVAPAEERDDLDETNKVLTLNGTVASPEPEFSVALISEGGNDQKVYTLGDAVGPGATLHAVYAERVVLNENGKLTNLKLPREFSNTPAPRVRRQATPTRPSANNAQSIQNVVSKNMTKLTDVIRPTPYLKEGQPAGYRVYPGRDRKQFAALGLRPGDIIKDIDGQSLTDPTQAMQIFQSLGTAEQVTVTVERNGQSESLILKTSQLDLSGDKTK